MIEVLVALSVAAAVLSAIAVAVVLSLRNGQFSKNQNLAAQYAAQGMEIIRELRDSRVSLSDFSGHYCLPRDSLILTDPNLECDANVGPRDIGPTPGNVNLYKREVVIDTLNSDCKNNEGPQNYKVTIKVSWWDTACGNTSLFCHAINLTSCLSNRTVLPTP